MKDTTSSEGMSTIVKTVARWLKGLILLYGIYIVLYGHLSPGGGFAGGVIIACAFVLVTLAFGQGRALALAPKRVVSELDSIGVLVFWAAAVLGIWVAGTFFTNFVATPQSAHFTLLSGGIIPLCNIGIGLKVGASLFLVFSVLAALRVARRDQDAKGGAP